MVGRIIVVGLVAVVAIVVWFVWFMRAKRRRSAQVLRWVKGGLAGHGRVSNAGWETSTLFHVRLNVFPNLFRQASIDVEFFRREIPVCWLLSRIRRQQERLTFSADLDCPPSFNLEVHNHRWFGRTRKHLPRDNNWKVEQMMPFVMTTRNDWQREIMQMMDALMASRECDCMAICFRRTSPNFTATVPLDAISLDSPGSDIFDVLRELATGASAARF